ncbi:MAG: hypothetical protein O7C01_02310, partial [Actinobacteria bacterium]|nr:hypothetical protein [Actinomycetota bacterium]
MRPSRGGRAAIAALAQVSPSVVAHTCNGIGDQVGTEPGIGVEIDRQRRRTTLEQVVKGSGLAGDAIRPDNTVSGVRQPDG